MKKIVFFFSIVILSACGLFNDKETTIEEIEPFEIETLRSFAPDTISYFEVDESNNIFVATKKRWFISSDLGASFQSFDQPDSTYFKRIELLGNTFYAIGVIKVPFDLWGDSTFTITVDSNILYRSDEGSNWTKVLGPFLMGDLLLDQNGFLHISKYGGVSSIDLSDGKEYLNQFLNTNSLDFVTMMSMSPNGDVYAVSHDGIYKTTDNGKNWNRISQEIPKNLDDIHYIKILNEDTFIAHGTRRVYSSENGEDWNWYDMYAWSPYTKEDLTLRRDTFYPNGFTVDKKGNLYAINSIGIFYAKSDSISEFDWLGPKGYDYDTPFKFSKVFSTMNGDLILQDGSYLAIAKKNPTSSYWDSN
ncbi:MAG: hypothetical protein ABJK11_13095 [Balneola sp.]